MAQAGMGFSGPALSPFQGGYRTAWEAARGALERYNPPSVASGVPATEYGGLIYESGGRYFHTPAVMGEEDSHVDPWSPLSLVPEDAQGRIVGEYHTHGGPNPADPTEGEIFSGLHYPGAVFGDPTGRVSVFLDSHSSYISTGDLAGARAAISAHGSNILSARAYTSFIGTPQRRFGAYNPFTGSVFTFSPSGRLLP
jgi:hypothetical protein